MEEKKVIQIESILSKSSVLKYKNDILAEKDEHFNLFTVLHKQTDEVRLHSRFISNLLSPFSSHKKGTLFLEIFLKHLNITDFDFDKIEVYPTEIEKSEFREIDILIINRSKKKAIIIENKIFAGDSNHEDRGQIEGYVKLIRDDEKISFNDIFTYYLTLDGHEPTDESLGAFKNNENFNFKTLNYSIEIRSWLNDCLKECYNEPFLRESIMQYIKLIDKMTHNTNIQIREELVDLIGSSEDNMQGAKFILDNAKHIKWHTVNNFWKDLESEILNKGYEVIESPSEDNITNTTHYETYRKSYYSYVDYGIKFKVTGEFNICIWNGTKEDWLYWGILRSGLDEAILEKIENFKAGSPDYFESTEKWLVWRYFDLSEEENIFFEDFSHSGTFNLIKRDYRDMIIKEKLLPEIISFLDSIDRK